MQDMGLFTAIIFFTIRKKTQIKENIQTQDNKALIKACGFLLG